MAAKKIRACFTEHAASFPAAMLRFAVFVPFGFYDSYAENHWNVIKAHALLQPGGPYDPAIAAGEKLAASWSKFGFWWTFAVWVPAMLIPAPLSFIFGIIDALVAVYISLATHAQTSYAPHRIPLCQGMGAHQLQRPPGMNESFFEAAARLNATTTEPFKMCKTFAQEWQYGVTVSFFYSFIALLEIMMFIGATIASYREARKTNKPYWRPTLLMFLAVPKVISMLLLVILYIIPEVFFRCLPISVKSRVRMTRQSGVKAGQIVEQKSEILLKDIKRKIGMKDQRANYVGKSEGTPANLADFLSVYDMLILVVENLHYVDVVNLGLVSKSVRESVLPADAYTQRMIHFKMYTCKQRRKTQCWLCHNQVCEVCKCSRSLKQTIPNFHLDTCQPHCTTCYFATVQRPHIETLPVTPAISSKIKDPRRCDCVPVTSTPNFLQRWWNGDAYYTTRQVNIPCVVRDVCRHCTALTDEELLGKREARTKRELRMGWCMSGQRKRVECVGCERLLRGGVKSVVWWVCKVCKRECGSFMHGVCGSGNAKRHEDKALVVVGEDAV